MLQSYGINIGFKEHLNRVYLLPRPTLRRVRQGFSFLIQVQPKKHFSTQTLSINCTKHTTPQLFSKSQLYYFFKKNNNNFELIEPQVINSSGSYSGSHHNSSRINSSPLKDLTVLWLHNSWLTTQNIQHLNNHVIHNPLRTKWLSLTHNPNHNFIIK